MSYTPSLVSTGIGAKSGLGASLSAPPAVNPTANSTVTYTPPNWLDTLLSDIQANAATLGVAGVAIGGGYWLFKKFFKKGSGGKNYL